MLVWESETSLQIPPSVFSPPHPRFIYLHSLSARLTIYQPSTIHLPIYPHHPPTHLPTELGIVLKIVLNLSYYFYKHCSGDDSSYQMGSTLPSEGRQGPCKH